jgi:proline--tRNA ligase
VRIAIGPKDLENGMVEIARRDTLSKETQPIAGVENYIHQLLTKIQEDIYQRALNFRNENITKVDTYEEFKKVLEEKGGFIAAHWDGTEEEEERIKEETKATIRCIPLDAVEEDGVSLISGKPSKRRVLFAKAY